MGSVCSLRIALLSVLLLCAGGAVAQSFDLAAGRVAVVSLDGAWRFHPGDSPVHNGKMDWAQPGFDDGAWALLKGDRSWSVQGYEGMGGYAWYRCSIVIPPGDRPTGLLLAPIMTGWRVFVDGREAGGAGNMPPNHTPNPSLSFKEFPLSPGGGSTARTVEIALRVWHSPMWAGYVGGGFYQAGSLAGDPARLASELEHQTVARHARFAGLYAYSIASGLIGLVILWLFLIRPVEREYLWFAALVLAQCADCVLNIAKEIWAVPSVPVFDMIDAAFASIVAAALLLFISRILNAPLGKRAIALFAMLAISPFCDSLYWPGWASPATSAALQLTFLLPALFWAIFLLVRSALRRNQDARLLLFPVLLAMGYYVLDNLMYLLSEANLVERPAFMDRRLPLPPFSLQIQIVFYLVFLLAMLVFLIRRFTLARRREERLASEFEAARQVQQVLLPDRLEPCPGFHVDSVYRPADEVGGDFFQQIADGRGGMLIVVGDVSGKGLPAAMIVSMLVGAIRAEADRGTGPAALLLSLNARMRGRTHGGFVTCLAAHLDASGALTIANAGHLSPYRNGSELELPGALPLGLLPEADYEEVSLQLKPGDRLMFLSDGVVEAQSRTGELFGFDRTGSLAMRAAHEIARAAQDFGQEDDITVVTVEFSGASCDAESSRAVVGAGTGAARQPATA
jgi:phosphoserine phosphatase RsbU/P